MHRRALLSLLPATAIVGELYAAALSPQLEDFRKALNIKFSTKRRAYQTADATLMRDQYYSTDAIIFGEDLKAIVGSQAIYDAYRKILPQRTDVIIGPPRVGLSDDATLGYAVVVIDVVIKSSRPKMETLMLLWRRTSGDWRCFFEVAVFGDQVSEAFGSAPPTAA